MKKTNQSKSAEAQKYLDGLYKKHLRRRTLRRGALQLMGQVLAGLFFGVIAFWLVAALVGGAKALVDLDDLQSQIKELQSGLADSNGVVDQKINLLLLAQTNALHNLTNSAIDLRGRAAALEGEYWWVTNWLYGSNCIRLTFTNAYVSQSLTNAINAIGPTNGWVWPIQN